MGIPAVVIPITCCRLRNVQVRCPAGITGIDNRIDNQRPERKSGASNQNVQFSQKHILPYRYLTLSPSRAVKEMTKMKEMQTNDHPSVAKVVELIGSSPNSWEEAAANAVEAASRTIRNITGVDVKRCTAKVQDNRIVEYRADVKVAFIVERE